MAELPPQATKNSTDNILGRISDDDRHILEQFITSFDLSPHTRKALLHDIGAFNLWFESVYNEPLKYQRVISRDISTYRDYLQNEKHLSVATVCRSIASLKKLFKWLCSEGFLTSNPTNGVKSPRRQPLAPRGLTKTECRKLLREVTIRGNERDTAIITLMLLTGARLGDVVNLHMDSVTIAERSGHVVYRGKFNKTRTVPLPLAARKALSAYIAKRGSTTETNLFIGQRGALDGRAIQSIVSKYGRYAGINVHCHALRHSYAAEYLAQGGNLVALSQLLGHSSLSSTSVYTQSSLASLAQSVEHLDF